MTQDFIYTAKNTILANDLYGLLFLLAGGLFIYLIGLKALLPLINYLVDKSPTKIDNAFRDRKVFLKLVWLPSLMFINQYSHITGEWQGLISKLVNVALVMVFIGAFSCFLLGLNDVYEKLPRAKGKPIKGFVQILQMIAYIFGTVAAVSMLMNKSPWVFLSGLGAMTAVLLLVFKDTILSLVASIRITANGLIEIGDWIEMPQYGADGDVIDIALHSIQIQNWDKTITSIPTHKLIDDSFKNWKGMELAGGRRIRREIMIDLESVRFCDEQMLASFEKIELLKDYLTAKKKEITDYNRNIGIAADDYTNGRHLTNLGTFRAYIAEYLTRSPHINHNLTTMVRQMQSGATGIPLQIWTFTKTTAWKEYEGIQSDIFDHLLAIVPVFGLRVFQYPSGKDLQMLNR